MTCKAKERRKKELFMVAELCQLEEDYKNLKAITDRYTPPTSAEPVWLLRRIRLDIKNTKERLRRLA